jgi:hypothetical protein
MCLPIDKRHILCWKSTFQAVFLSPRQRHTAFIPMRSDVLLRSIFKHRNNGTPIPVASHQHLSQPPLRLCRAYSLKSSKIPDYFNVILTSPIPDLCDQSLLARAGFRYAIDRPFIDILKELGFLEANGRPTSRYRDFRDPRLAPAALRRGLNEAYAGLFASLPDACARSERQVMDAISQLLGGEKCDMVVGGMARTFLALCRYAEHLEAGHAPVQAGQDVAAARSAPGPEAAPPGAPVAQAAPRADIPPQPRTGADAARAASPETIPQVVPAAPVNPPAQAAPDIPVVPSAPITPSAQAVPVIPAAPVAQAAPDIPDVPSVPDTAGPAAAPAAPPSPDPIPSQGNDAAPDHEAEPGTALLFPIEAFLGEATRAEQQVQADNPAPSEQAKAATRPPIQIVLPASADEAVYDAIFASLKRHLLPPESQP